MAANNKTIQVQSNVPPVAPQAGESHMLEILIIVGILVAIAAKHKLPVYFIGVGEGVDDLEPFEAKDFAQAIVGDTE